MSDIIRCPICGQPLDLLYDWSRTPQLGHKGNLILKPCHYNRIATLDEINQMTGGIL